MATTISSIFDGVNFKPEFSDVTSMTPSNGDCCGSRVTPTEFLPEHQSSDEEYGNSDDSFGYENVYYPLSDGQSEHFCNDGDLSPENDELGGSSDNEQEDDTDDEMEDDDAEIEGVAATASSMKDVFLFPNSTITLSVEGNILSKSMQYVQAPAV